MDWMSPATFDWDDAPLNKVYYPLSAIAVYLFLIIFLERRAINKGVDPSLLAVIKKCQVFHNLGLCLVSLTLVLLMSVTVVQKTWYPEQGDPEQNTSFLTCPISPTPSRGKFWYWVYLFYLTKYWELLDTVLQMAKGRRPPSYYFHVWHHTVYLLICYGYCSYRSSLAGLAVIINGSVHVVMYYYYHLVARGISPWWKRHITKMQIVQFLLGYCCFSRTIKLQYVDGFKCNGKEILAYHAAFNLTMLVGFFRILARIQGDHKKTGKRI